MDIYKLRFMLAVMEQLMPVKTFLKDLFFTELEPVNTSAIDIDVIKGKRRMAPMQSPLIEGKQVESLAFTTNTYTPPYVKPKKVSQAQQYLNRSAGETIYSNSMTPAQRAQNEVAKELRELDELVTRREEWMAAQALTTGKIPVVGDGVSYVIDFLMAATHIVTLTGTDLWTNAASDPMADLKTWRILNLKDSGVLPNVIVMAQDAYDAFITHAKVKDVLDNRRIDLGFIKPEDVPSGAMYMGFLRDIACDLYVYNEWYVPDDGGAEEPMFPDNKILMGSTKARCDFHYAAIQDLEALASVKRYPKSWLVKDPSSRLIQVQSAPLAGLHQPDAFVVAKVV